VTEPNPLDVKRRKNYRRSRVRKREISNQRHPEIMIPAKPFHRQMSLLNENKQGRWLCSIEFTFLQPPP